MKTTQTLAVLAGVLLLVGQANAGDDPKVAAEVMALARAQWDAEVAGKSVAEQMADTADDYTEFNPDYPVRLDGKALNSRLCGGNEFGRLEVAAGRHAEREGAGLR